MINSFGYDWISRKKNELKYFIQLFKKKLNSSLYLLCSSKIRFHKSLLYNVFYGSRIIVFYLKYIKLVSGIVDSASGHTSSHGGKIYLYKWPTVWSHSWTTFRKLVFKNKISTKKRFWYIRMSDKYNTTYRTSCILNCVR